MSENVLGMAFAYFFELRFHFTCGGLVGHHSKFVGCEWDFLITFHFSEICKKCSFGVPKTLGMA